MKACVPVCLGFLLQVGCAQPVEMQANVTAPIPAPPASVGDKVPPQPMIRGGDDWKSLSVPGYDEVFLFERYIVSVNVFSKQEIAVYPRRRAIPDARVNSQDLVDPIYRLEGQPSSLGALVGDVLVVDVGTGPDWRDLILVDLRTGRERLRDEYMTEATILLGDGLVYFGRTKQQGRASRDEQAECDKDGLGIEQHELICINLRTLQRRSSGLRAWHCMQ